MKDVINYQQIVARLKQEVEAARMNAALTVNKQMLVLYWRIGKIILEQQESQGWGTKVVDRLAIDLRKAFPDMKGFSPRNLKYMRAFAEAYPEFVQDPLAQISSNQIVQDPLAQITWYHHITLLDKVKDENARMFYITRTTENGWSRNVMVHQLESKLYERQGKAVTNFNSTLPASQSDLAREILKDPYKFDFLSLSEEYMEKDLEDALVKHITKFLLELGAGFSYVGRQYAVEVGGKDYEIDLLFYHLKLRCFVVVELKKGEFTPEHAGKLNFYLNAVDDLLRHPVDSPSIGILICKERNKIVAEYALRGIDKPIGIAEYELTQAIPEKLKGSLPTIEEIEKELE
ncbi:MAG TPA: PDDEXK nuclease domain-containing protein [Segetibacter sp.]|jgi:predicted nuclease of restriction endonuclease-like (RecB) superfamily